MRITIAPFDHLNPGHGYQLKIESNDGVELISCSTNEHLSIYENAHLYYLAGILNNFIEDCMSNEVITCPEKK